MSIIYERILELCQERGITPYRMCQEAQVPKNIMTELKMGRKQNLSSKTAAKLAEYFGVTVDSLISGSASKKEALPDLTDEDKQDIAKRLEDTLSQLMLRQEGLMFDGEPLDDVTRELLETSLRNSMELAKRMSKAREAEKRKEK